MAAHTKLGSALRMLVAPERLTASGELSDRDLVRQFVTCRDEQAFAALLNRHGPMVLGVASRVLRNHPDAEDVFQATFLLLARKAGSIRKAESVGSWLHGVAHFLARRTVTRHIHRTRREQKAATMRFLRDQQPSGCHELEPVLDGALQELPEIYRQVLIACHLEDKSHADASRMLGCSLATLRSRLVRGRKRLHTILSKRGITLSTGALSAVLSSHSAEAARFAPLLRPTLEACMQFAAGKSAETVAAGSVASLVDFGLKGLFLAKTLIGTVLLLSFGLIVGTVGAMTNWSAPALVTDPSFQSTTTTSPAKQVKPVTRLTDNFGDPLPEGAIKRLGTIRFRHGGKIESVAYSPDGTRIVTGGADCKVKIWDRKTGKELVSFDGHSDDVHFVTFTPDGKYVISSSGGFTSGQRPRDPCTLKWEANTGKKVLRFPGNKWNLAMAALALSPDGKKLAACISPELYIFDVDTGQFLHTYPAADGIVLKVQFSPDGRNLAMLGMGQGVSLLEVLTGKVIWKNEQLMGDMTTWEPAASGLAFAPDGQRIAARIAPDQRTSFVGPIRLLDANSGAELSRFDKDGSGPICFGDDGKTMLTTSATWDLETGRQLSSTLRGGRVYEIALSPDGKEVSEAAGIALLRLDPRSSKPLPDSGVGHGTYTQISFSTDFKSIVATSHFDPEAQLRGWSLEKGTQQFAYLGLPLHPLAIAPESDTLAYGNYAEPGKVFRKKLGSWTEIEPALIGNGTAVKALVYSGDGGKLFGALGERGSNVSQVRAGGPVFMWDLHKESEPKNIGQLPQGSGVRCLAVSPDNRILAAGCWDNSIQILDLKDGRPDKALLGQQGSICAIAISPDSKVLAAVSGAPQTGPYKTATGYASFGYDAIIRIWNLETGKVVLELHAPPEGSWSIAWSPDGKRLASGGEDGIVRIWDRDSGREQLNLKGHAGPVTSLAFTPDGKRLLSGSVDTTILVWDMGRLPGIGDPSQGKGQPSGSGTR